MFCSDFFASDLKRWNTASGVTWSDEFL